MPNAVPIVVADIVTITELNPFTPQYVSVLTNDTDPDGDPLHIVAGSLVVTGFTTSAGVPLSPQFGPVLSVGWLQTQFSANAITHPIDPPINPTQITVSPTGSVGSFQFLSAGQSITVTMTYNVSDSFNNISQSTLTLTINGINNVLTLDDAANSVAEFTNTVQSTRFADEIYAMGGDDVVYAINGDDIVYGGTGDDSLYGGDSADKLFGEADDDYLSGGSGNDMIYGGAGEDVVAGGSGDDQLWGGADADLYGGGSGLDYARYDDANWGNLSLRLDNSAFNAGAAAVGDTYSGIEGLVGGLGNDVVIGNASANFLFGGGGIDYIDGLAGSDYLNGGAGVDRFRFSTALGSTNVDIVADFTHGTDDFYLMQSIFLGIGATLDVSELRLGTAAADANDYVIYNSTTGQLFYDANGNGVGGQTLFATVTVGTVLDTADFVMV